MKSIDFTKPGGFPLTQDQLGYLQTAYTESVYALTNMGGNGPFVVSGCVITKSLVTGTTYNYAMTDGWIFYQGNMVKVNAGGLLSINESVDATYMQVNTSANPLTYNDGSTPSVVLDSYITLVAQPIGTADDTTHFLLSELAPFGTGFGMNNRESTWNSLVVNTLAADGGVTGTIYYKKNFVTNTLHIRSYLSSANAQNFPASPAAIYSLMGTLPTGYLPNNNAYFTGYYFAANLIKDDLGIAWIKHLTCAVNTGGQVSVNWLRPDSAISGYAVIFNAVIPLD